MHLSTVLECRWFARDPFSAKGSVAPWIYADYFAIWYETDLCNIIASLASMQRLIPFVFTMTSSKENNSSCFQWFWVVKMQVFLIFTKWNIYQFKSLWQLVQSIHINNVNYFSQYNSFVAYFFLISKSCFCQVVFHLPKTNFYKITYLYSSFISNRRIYNEEKA